MINSTNSLSLHSFFCERIKFNQLEVLSTWINIDFIFSFYIYFYTHTYMFEKWTLLCVEAPRMLWTYAPDKLFYTFFLTSKFYFFFICLNKRKKNYEWFVFKQTFSPHYIYHIIFLIQTSLALLYLNKVSDQISIRIVFKGTCMPARV